MTYRLEFNRNELRALTGETPGPVQQAFIFSAQEIANRAVDELQGAGSIPTTVDTGALARSVAVGPLEVSSGRVHTEIGSRLEYAGIIHAGRGEVFPRGQFLKWPNRGGKGKKSGPFVFARSSPAVKERPFMTLGLEKATAAIRRLFGG